MKFPIKSLILLGSVAPFAAYCQMNQWLLLSDFEDGEAGLVETFHVDLDPSYEVAAIFAVLEDPVDAENSVFWWDASGYGINWNAHRMNMPLPQEVPEGEVATLYFRSYSEGYSHDGNVGMSDVPLVPITGEGSTSDLVKTFTDTLFIPLAEPRAWGDLEVQANIFSGQGPGVVVRDGGAFTQTEPGVPLNTWVEYWLVADNANDTTKLYWRAEGETDITLVTVLPPEAAPKDNFNFRNGTTDPLVTFSFLGTAGNPSNPHAGDIFYWDDIALYVGAAMLETPNFEGGNTWCGIEKVGTDVNTGDWMGWLSVGDATGAPSWAYSYTLETFVYMGSCPDDNGAWVYVMNME